MVGCGHCGYAGALDAKGNGVVAESRRDYVEQYGEIDIQTIWSLYRCPNCGEPTLGRYVWVDEFSDPESVEPQRIYPKSDHGEELPPNIRKAYDLALRGRSVDPAFYAVGVRRTLEAICDHEGFAGTNLDKRLGALAASGRLPADLADLTSSLRRIGNIGAHEGLGEITTDDLPAVADLMEALLEYLYRAPAKLAAVRASFASRGVQL